MFVVTSELADMPFNVTLALLFGPEPGLEIRARKDIAFVEIDAICEGRDAFLGLRLLKGLFDMFSDCDDMMQDAGRTIYIELAE